MTERLAALPSIEAVNAMVREGFPGSANVCSELGRGYAVATRQVDATEIRPGGYISGPTQFGIADAALWFLVFAVTGRVEPMALTSELSIRFLRPALGEVLWARADVDAAVRRTVIGTVRVWTDDREDEPSAVAQGTYVVPAPEL